MRVLLHEVARRLEAGESLVTATIVRKSGSAPRSGGSRMIVRADGSISGSVGGGRLEADMVRLAMSVFRTGQPVLQVFDLTGTDAAGTDMICGGRGEILIDFLDAGVAGTAGVFAEAARGLDAGHAGWLLTAIGATGAGPGRHALVRPDGSVRGAEVAPPGLAARLAAERGRHAIRIEPDGDRRVVVEPLRYGGRMVLFGAGHCSQKLAALAGSVELAVTVVDDRAEFASPALFPDPVERVVIESFDRLPGLGVSEDCFLVIMTRGHLHDMAVLEQCLRTRAGYIGMIGSVRKRDMLFRELATKGFGPDDFARVHAPIGIEIDAETPEEIAISIAAELVKVRAARGRAGAQERA